MNSEGPRRKAWEKCSPDRTVGYNKPMRTRWQEHNINRTQVICWFGDRDHWS